MLAQLLYALAGLHVRPAGAPRHREHHPGRQTHRRRRGISVLFAALLGLGGTGPAGAAPYALGHGYPLPWLGLTAGGYVSIRASKLESDKARISVPDLSLFLRSDVSPRWHFFSEMELGNALTWTRDGLSTSDADLDVERLYLDHNLSSKLTLRLGKFLTPIGRWNLIHADPLVWSVSRPLTTATAFSRHAAGLELSGSWPLGQSALDYRLFADDTALLDRSQRNERVFVDTPYQPNPRNAFDHGGGLRLRYLTFDEALQVGFSAARFRLKDRPGMRELIGADLLYTRAGFEVTGETIYRRSEGAGGDEWGGFAQLVAPLGHHFFGVVCQERYKVEGYPRPTNSARFGVTYRPTPPLSFKLELRQAWGEERLAPDGWLFSVAVLL